MPSNPFLNDSDQFIVGRQSDNKTYKTSFENLKHDIGVHIGDTEPTDPIDGAIWVDTSECPPKLQIWAECNGEWFDPHQITIKEKNLMKDINGNVFIRGNLYIVQSAISDVSGPTPTQGGANVIYDEFGDVYITGDFSSKDIYTGTFNITEPVEEVIEDSNGNVAIEGSVYVLGDVYTKNTITIP